MGNASLYWYNHQKASSLSQKTHNEIPMPEYDRCIIDPESLPQTPHPPGHPSRRAGTQAESNVLSVYLLLTTILAASVNCHADELTLENVAAPEPNSADEPLAKSFSLKSATRFLDQASLNWINTHACFTCHTNYAYLIARPAVKDGGKAHSQVRAALEGIVSKRWENEGPTGDADVVMSAAVLALNDNATTGKLHTATRKALDRMWTVQKEDGGVNWYKCGWAPMESDDEFGACMMALAVGAASEAYRDTKGAKAGLAKLREYFSKNAPPTLHHSAMMVWADSYLGDLLTEQDRKDMVEKLRNLQNDDGGWGLASLGDWERGDGKEQDPSSDGYGTGFVVYVLRRAGLPANDPQLQKGVTWLKANQRASGRWFTRSVYKDNEHYISHAGSAFAVLAITLCTEERGSR